ncbi:hypothetical protein C8J55DRAFT_484917 [Lentinula edodes]|uniref:WD40 repeat-like protein n=1 Tax=Lentinula lateritia TaxID=40482 RepID=A0A9W9AYF4_9AGAR|nr:hypothetical protein C8J55DRAFT_484917 [Lentinula edodes]
MSADLFTTFVLTHIKARRELSAFKGLLGMAETNDLEYSIQYKTSAVGKGGFRIKASRNLWDGSSLKIDSNGTSVVWCGEEYKNKILTSARNGEVIIWDINKSGSKYDGDLRVRDLREFQKSIMRVRRPTGIRTIVFSLVVWSPLQAIVRLYNGSIYRWDLEMRQRGSLDRIIIAQSASVTCLDWCSTFTATSASSPSTFEATGYGYG